MKTRILLLVGVSVLLAGVVSAQETPAPNQGGGDISGTFTVGYRLVDVSGKSESAWDSVNASNLFREQYSLSKGGPSLGNQLPMSLNLFGTKAGVFDQFFLNAEFNPTVQGGSLRLRDFGAYDLNVSYKNVNYYYDRYDSLYNDLRHHESSRQDLSAMLDIHATENVGLELGYRAIGHGGFVQLPRPLYLEAGVEGPDRVFFNVFRNYFLQELPRTDLNTELHLGINADFDMFSVKLGGGFTDFKEEFEMTPAQTRDALPLNYRSRDSVAGYSNEFGIVGDNNAAEHLNFFYHNEQREMSGPFFFGQAIVRPADMFSLSANFRMEQLEGETVLDLGEQAEIRRTAGSGASMRRHNYYMRGTQTGEVKNTLDRMMLSAVATVMPIPELDVNAGIKITNHDLVSNSEYHIYLDTASIAANSTFASAIDSTGQPAHLVFASTNTQPVMTVFGNVNVAPMRDLSLTAGVTMISRTPEVNRTHHGDADSVIANNMSKETASLGFNVGIGYRIMPELRVRGRFEMLQREAKFSDQTFAPAAQPAGSVTDLEPRTAPEDVMRIGANMDWRAAEGLDVGLRFLMSNAKSDLNESMWITADLGNPVEFKNDDMTISANLGYALDENTSIRLMGESRSQSMSIPVTWTRGQKLIPIFGAEPGVPVYQNQVDSASVILSQETNDLFFDLGIDTKVAEKLTLGAGFSFLDVSGNPSITPDVGGSGNYASTPTRQGDVTRTGGPFSRITVNGKIGYDITQQFGILLDMFYAMQDEKEVDLDKPGMAPAEVRFYGLNDYNGFSAAINAVYNF